MSPQMLPGACALVIALSGLILAGGCASSASTRSDATPLQGDGVELSLMDATPIEADRAVLYVEGLSCPACATNVDHQLMEVDGVRLVEVNLGDGTVTLSLGGAKRPSRALLAQAIHDSGFTLRRIETP